MTSVALAGASISAGTAGRAGTAGLAAAGAADSVVAHPNASKAAHESRIFETVIERFLRMKGSADPIRTHGDPLDQQRRRTMTQGIVPVGGHLPSRHVATTPRYSQVMPPLSGRAER